MGVWRLCSLWLLLQLNCGVHSWLLNSYRLRERRRKLPCLAVSSQPGVSIQDQLDVAYETIGICDPKYNETSANLPLSIIVSVFRDYYKTNMIPETVEALKIDFGIDNAINAHCLRAALWQLYREEEGLTTCYSIDKASTLETQGRAPPQRAISTRIPEISSSLELDVLSTTDTKTNDNVPDKLRTPRKLYKQVALTNTVSRNRTYSDDPLPAALKQELELDYYEEFLVKPTPDSPTPLRAATAKTYLRHAKLFVQWYTSTSDSVTNTTRLSDILDSSGDEASVQCFWDFCSFLRTERAIAKSYESNLWRGLGKLLKYRHGADVPATLLVRRWHREAQQAAKKAPRSSNEERKWLTWPQYLSVVQTCRSEYKSLLDIAKTQGANSTLDRKIAIALQRYLVLAVFATVPDRQRTIRELEIGSTLCQVDGVWCIRHTSEKYKTGKTYGERPLLKLGPISAEIDAFLELWRSKLLGDNQHDFLFLQVRTGRQLTQDSVYQLVGRACYEHTGQRTNPHLLRDMIVTHVRESNQASEQELEALGMFLDFGIFPRCDSPSSCSIIDGTQHRGTTFFV